MTEYLLGTRTISLRASDVVGKGGEADIYRKGGDAFKVFKAPTHTDLAGMPQLQREATERIREHQKKLPAFPRNLPSRVSSPGTLLTDKTGLIVGYQMNFIDNAEVLLRYGEPKFRAQGISDDSVVRLLADLYRTVAAVHKAGVVIGDFNDLNILCKGEEAHIIDADSMQFGSFVANMFTQKFVDPLICDPQKDRPSKIGSYSNETDWYAYLIMLMQSLLFVGPYGGVYRPKDHTKFVAHDARSLKRITVFDPEVLYPKPARAYKILPDDLLGYFEQVFKKNKRGAPSLSLIESLRFTLCSKCGKLHARSQCPECVAVTPPMLKEVHLGQVKGVKVFETSGSILFATMQGGKLRYLYHHSGAYQREGERAVVEAPLDPAIRFRIRGADTLLARGRQCLVFEGGKVGTPKSISVDAYGLLPLIEANEEHILFVEGGALYRTGKLGLDYPERIGDVLPNQTLFWAGSTLGFGFYRAAELSSYFVFRPQHRGINDSVNLPGIRGQLIDSTALFGENKIWFFVSTQENGRTINRCFLLNGNGVLLGSAESPSEDGSWLGKIRGATATGDFLLSPTDDGVQRIRLAGSNLSVDKEYAHTHRFVDSGSTLFIGNDGLYTVRPHDIWRLVVG